MKKVIAGRLEDPFEKVQLEAAAALCDMDDYQGIPLLIRTGLRSVDPNNRFSSFRTLRTTFKVTFNYEYNAKAETREESIKQWENWWHENQNKYLVKN